MDIREFKNTYIKYAPSIIWDWCAKPTAEEIDAKLYEFSQMGICRIYIRPSKGLVLPYLSADYFELIRTAARRGGRYGIKIGIFDENSPASGNGGGEITSVSDYRLLDILKVKKNDVEKFDELIMEDAENAIVLRDMSKVRLSGRAPLADITDEFVTECFIDSVYNKYIRECKRFIGIEIEGFLTNINIPEDALLYSASSLKKLQNPAIQDILAEKKDAYFDALSECISENFTGIIKEKCKENELFLSVNANGNKNISRQMQYLKGDAISLCVDTENPDFTEIKLAQTISEAFEKPFNVRLLMPSFAPCSYRYNKASFMASFGAESIVYDSVAFSLSDRRKYEKHTVTVSKFSEKTISERLARLCFVGANTNCEANILVVYSPEGKCLYDDISKRLLSKGVSFHMIEESVFRKFGANSGGFITFGKCQYDTVIGSKKALSTLDGFEGEVINADYDINCDALITPLSLSIETDKDVIISRRKNGDDEYIFITSGKEDTPILVTLSEKKLFVADSSNGELYKVQSTDGKSTFTLKAGKTAMLIYSDNLSEDNAPPYTDDIEFTPHEKKSDVPFALSSAEENILPLRNVNACFGRKSFRENSIDNLHKEFYALADGETVKVKYPFNADLESIGEVRAYIENADNLDFVELNGKRLTDFSPSEKDARFKGVNISPLLADGKNSLALGYKKSNNYNPDFSSFTPSHFSSYNITSFEPVYLCGDFDAASNSLIRLSEYDNDITKSGMEYYYGPLTYEAKLPEKDLSGNILAIHGDFDICHIKIGKRSYTFFSETPMLEVFNLDCEAVAEITIYNTPHNLLRSLGEETKPFGLQKITLCKFSN